MSGWHSMQQRIAFTIAVMMCSTASYSSADTALPTFEWQKFEDYHYLYGTPWSPDNQYLAVASLDDAGLLLLNREVWSVDRQVALPTTAAPLSGIQWSPNGAYVTVNSDTELIALNVTDGRLTSLTELLSREDGPIVETRWLGKSNVLAVFAAYGKISLIDVEARRLTQDIELDAYRASFFYTAFDWNQHSSLFAVPLYSSNTIGFWDDAGRMSANLVQENALDERRFASQCGNFGVDNPSPLEFNFSGLGGNADLTDIAWANDGSQIAFTSSYSAIVCTLNPQRTAMTRVRQLRIPDQVDAPNDSARDVQPYSETFKVSWSPDDHWLLVSLLPIPAGLPQNSCGIAVFDATQDYAYMGRIAKQSCSIHDMSWSPDGSQFVITTQPSGYWVGTLLHD